MVHALVRGKFGQLQQILGNDLCSVRELRFEIILISIRANSGKRTQADALAV